MHRLPVCSRSPAWAVGLASASPAPVSTSSRARPSGSSRGDRRGALAPALDQAPERRALIGKEADPQLAFSFGWQAQAGPVGGKPRVILLPGIPLGDEPPFAQEAAGSR